MYRLRVTYGKVGPLRFLGHLEVCRALERGVRRARLPIAYGQGFNPKARLAFGPALPVGVAGEREYVDLKLDDYVAPAEAAAALEDALPKGLPVSGAAYVKADAPSLAADTAVVVYLVELAGLGEDALPALEEGLARFADLTTLDVERRGGVRTYDLGRAIYRRPKLTDVDGTPALELWLAMVDQAPIRPDAVALEIARETPASYMRVARMECYAQRRDALVALSEVG